MTTEKPNLSWQELLNAAVTEPGILLKAYSAFHNYSIGNQLAAMVQCQLRGIEPSPINTYQGWQKLNRQVKKGEKAMWLCMPLTKKRKDDRGEDKMFISGFIWKPRWFTVSQTEGESVEMPSIPSWDKDRALANLQISQIPFDLLNGNVQGFARKRNIAISPIASLPVKTMFHEIAHIVLGHTAEANFQDDEYTPKSLREVEAEAVALILCESLNLEGTEYCRGYIQHWLDRAEIPEQSAARIFGATDKILKAGQIF